jgi:hypothetical protein
VACLDARGIREMSANGDSTIGINERAESADPEIVFQVRDNVDGNETDRATCTLDTRIEAKARNFILKTGRCCQTYVKCSGLSS